MADIRDYLKLMSGLSSVAEKEFRKVLELLYYVILHKIYEASEYSDDQLKVELPFIGDLAIDFIPSNLENTADEYYLRIKFIPKRRFQDDVKKVYLHREDILTDKVAEGYFDHIKDVYETILEEGDYKVE